jgi:hypothetical protein
LSRGQIRDDRKYLKGKRARGIDLEKISRSIRTNMITVGRVFGESFSFWEVPAGL